MPIIEIHLRKGRTIEQKRKLHKLVTEAAVNAVECDPKTIRIIINELGDGDFSVAGEVKDFKS
jgi:4-oxalocrotonate tautomerase family enzyme